MSKKKTKEQAALSEQTVEKLQAEKLTLKKELFNLRCQKVMGEANDTSRFKKSRKQVARINTELTKRLRSKK
jgi:large subunit ribosomal protein L29